MEVECKDMKRKRGVKILKEDGYESMKRNSSNDRKCKNVYRDRT
jgi:hypothetical protein